MISFKSHTRVPRVIVPFSVKLCIAIILMMLIAILRITAMYVNTTTTVQLSAMENSGQIISEQLAKSVFEAVSRIRRDNRNVIITMEINPMLKQNVSMNDVIYIKLFDEKKDKLWGGGSLERNIRDDDLPFYDRLLLKKGEKAPAMMRVIAHNSMSDLKPLAQLINRIVNLRDIHYDISSPVTLIGSDGMIGEVHIGFSQRRVNLMILAHLEKILQTALIIIAFSVAVSVLFSWFFTGPVTKLKNAMIMVEKGNLDQQVKVSTRDEIGLLTWNFNNMIRELKEKEKMRAAFGKAVSEEIVEVMMSGDLFLGGEEKDVTILFSDIRSFTKTSGTMTPAQVMEMLNEYFTLMEKIVQKNMGIIDKYVGDEIMAIFGATDSHQDHAENACRCAVEMIQELSSLNSRREHHGKPRLRIGVGINTGPVTAGMLGSENRMNYTVIGDTVNLASRLCDAGGAHGFTPIVIAEKTYEKVKHLLKVRSGHALRVKGKDVPIRIYELLGIINRKTAIHLKHTRILSRRKEYNNVRR